MLILLREDQICPYRFESWIDLNHSSIKSWFLTFFNGKNTKYHQLSFCHKTVYTDIEKSE